MIKRLLVEDTQGIRYVASCPTVFFHESVDVETDVQDMYLVRQYVVGKTSGKVHDPVICH